MYPPFDPILFQIGPLAMRWYGLLLVGGMIAARHRRQPYVERKGDNGDNVWDMLLFVLIPALIGARLYVFIQSPHAGGLGRFLDNPWTILQIWTGGIHIYGAFIFGGIALLAFAALAQAVGAALSGRGGAGRAARPSYRAHRQLHQPGAIRPADYAALGTAHRRRAPHPALQRPGCLPESVRFQPLFLYESLWNFVGFGLLFWISPPF